MVSLNTCDLLVALVVGSFWTQGPAPAAAPTVNAAPAAAAAPAAPATAASAKAGGLEHRRVCARGLTLAIDRLLRTYLLRIMLIIERP